VSGGLTLWWLVVVVLPAQPESLREYWEPTYLTGSVGEILATAWRRFDATSPRLGMAAPLVGVLAVVGIAVFRRLGSGALAIAVPVLLIEMVVLGITERYPFLDVRTSHFVLVVLLVAASVGATGLVLLLARRRRVVALVVAAVVLGAYVAQAPRSVGKLWISEEDTRGQTEAVAADLRPGDVVVVGRGADYGFAYYWPDGRLAFRTAEGPTGFRVTVRGVPAIYATDRSPAAVADAMSDAVAIRRAGPPGARIFVVLSHLGPAEERAWNRAFAALGVRPRMIDVGAEPLLVIGPARPRAAVSLPLRPGTTGEAVATLGRPDRRSSP
jgi:hypothetical protein